MGQGESRDRIEARLNEVRRNEQSKSSAELNKALATVQSQFQQELKKLSDNNSKREEEQQQVINKLQQQEKNLTSLVESLRSNLDEKQQELVVFGKRVGELEAQVLEEQEVSGDRKRRVEEVEEVNERLKEEVEREKATREEAMQKISYLEAEISDRTRDVEIERQRLKAAKERTILLEIKLRGLCAMTEEIKELLSKQQEKVEAMQMALEQRETEKVEAMQTALEQKETEKVEAMQMPLEQKETEKVEAMQMALEQKETPAPDVSPPLQTSTT